MSPEKWEEIKNTVRKNFSVEDEGVEDLLQETADGTVKQGEAEYLVFGSRTRNTTSATGAEIRRGSSISFRNRNSFILSRPTNGTIQLTSGKRWTPEPSDNKHVAPSVINPPHARVF